MVINLSILVALTIGLVQVAKDLGLESKYAPLLSILVATGLNFIIRYAGGTVGELIFTGIMAGLTSSGLYDLGDKGVEIVKEVK